MRRAPFLRFFSLVCTISSPTAANVPLIITTSGQQGSSSSAFLMSGTLETRKPSGDPGGSCWPL